MSRTFITMYALKDWKETEQELSWHATLQQIAAGCDDEWMGQLAASIETGAATRKLASAQEAVGVSWGKLSPEDLTAARQSLSDWIIKRLKPIRFAKLLMQALHTNTYTYILICISVYVYVDSNIYISSGT